MGALFRPEVFAHRAQRLHGEVVLSQSLSARVIALSLFATLAAVGIWLALGSFARIETAPGILSTSMPSAKVLAPTPGIVTTLGVTEGTLVAKGDRLAIVTVDRSAVGGGEGVAGASLVALKQRQELGEGQIAVAAVREAAERRQTTAVLKGAETEASQLIGQIALQREVVTSAQGLFEQIERVVENGFVSRFELERRRQAFLSARQSLGNLEAQRNAALSRAEQARGQLAVLASEGAARVSDLRSGQAILAQQQAQLRGDQAYLLTAPVAGRVTALQTAEGRTVNSSSPLMTIVPEGSELKAEIYAPSRAIGFVRPGQETRLLFDAFPYQRFGSFGGRVTSVSRIVIDPRESDVPIKLEEPVYRVTIALDRQQVSAYGEAVPLQPGMTLTANIVLERQSFLGWLLTPLRAVWRRT